MPTLVDFNTIPQLFNRLATRSEGKSRPVLQFMDKDTKQWTDVTWESFRDQVHSMAGFLYTNGVRPGDRVAILSENRPEWAFTDMATQLLGGVNVSLYTSLPPKEVSYIIHDSGASVFIVSTVIQLKKALEIYDLCPNLRLIVSMTPLKEEHPEYVTYFPDAMADGATHYNDYKDAIHALEATVKPDDLSCLIYTSGTTGNPKGVMLTHSNFSSNIKAAVGRFPFEEGDRHLSFLPLCHSFERTGGYLAALATGVIIIYAQSVDTVTRDIVEVKPTLLLAVPRLYEKIYNGVMKSVEEGSDTSKKIFNWAVKTGFKYNLAKAQGKPTGPFLAAGNAVAQKLVFSKLHAKLGGELRFGVSGGAALPKTIGEFFFAAGIPLVEGYGLTETSPVLTVSPLNKPRYGAVGYVIDGVTVAIQDLNDGHMLGQIKGEDYPSSLTTGAGEIVARGPNIMKGYWNNPQATSDAIDSEGWYHTGDVGRFDDGFLLITDRIKHMIVSAGGKNIYPGPIEEGFKHEPWIDQLNIIGEAREYLTALVVPSEDVVRAFAQEEGLQASSYEEMLAMDEIQRVFQQMFKSYSRQAASHEKLRDFRLIAEPFSVENGMMTPTMKLKRKVIEARYADLIEEMYAGVV